MFALSIFLCDQFVRLKPVNSTTMTTAEQGSTRFFRIMRRLHLDLQVVLCNRTAGLAGDIIPHLLIEAAFKKIAKKFSSHQS